MKRLILLLLSLVAVVLPWAPAAARRNWGLAAALLAAWLAAAAVASLLWFGPGLLALAALGIGVALTTAASLGPRAPAGQ